MTRPMLPIMHLFFHLCKEYIREADLSESVLWIIKVTEHSEVIRTSSGVWSSGVPKRGGVSTPHPRNSGGRPTSCQTQPDLKTVKNC